MLKQDAPVTSDGGSDLNQGTKEGIPLGVKGCQRQGRAGGHKSRRVQVPSGKDNDYKDEEMEWKDLNADLPVRVFSYLPQLELFEVMSVCKGWEEAETEASVLWKEVEVGK